MIFDPVVPGPLEMKILSAFAALGPFSMTEGAALALRADGSVTGFSQSMTTGVPEPATWAMLAIGFGFMAWGVASRRKVRDLIA